MVDPRTPVHRTCSLLDLGLSPQTLSSWQFCFPQTVHHFRLQNQNPVPSLVHQFWHQSVDGQVGRQCDLHWTHKGPYHGLETRRDFVPLDCIVQELFALPNLPLSSTVVTPTLSDAVLLPRHQSPHNKAFRLPRVPKPFVCIRPEYRAPKSVGRYRY